MKMIVAIIEPDRLSTVQMALRSKDTRLTTVSEVFGYGSELSPIQIYRGRAIRRPVPKLRIEVIVADFAVDIAVEAIVGAGFSDNLGQVCDDKLFVLALEQSISGQRCERAEPALAT
jgi:nitrogen regulatory protein P-II 1